MNKMLGIDVGIKRVGLATVDPFMKRAMPFTSVPRGKAEKTIIELVNQGKAELLVIGLPLNERGERTNQCDDVEKFTRRVERRCSVQVIYIDEFSTSYDAEEIVRQKYQGALSSAKRKAIRLSGEIDAVSAALILQKYLDSLHTTKGI